MKLLFNDKRVDMFRDTEIKGGYKPISVDSDNITANPHSYEFQIPLTDNNSSILSFNRSTFQFESEDIETKLYNDNGELILSGYAYINDIVIEKNGEAVSVMIVDFFTYILKKLKESYLGEIYNYDEELKNNYLYGYVNDMTVEIPDFMKYMFFDSTGYEGNKDLYGGNVFIFNGGIDAKGQVPLCINPIGYIKRLANCFGKNISVFNNDGILENIWCTIPIDSLRSSKEKKDEVVLEYKNNFATKEAIFYGVAESNLKTSHTVNAGALNSTGEDNEFRLYLDLSTEKNRKPYTQNIIPTYVEHQSINFSVGIKEDFDDYLTSYCNGGSITAAIYINGEKYIIGNGAIGVDCSGYLNIKLNEDRDGQDIQYLQPFELTAGEDLDGKIILIAENPIYFKTKNSKGSDYREILFVGDKISETGTTEYTKALSVSVIDPLWSNDIVVEFSDIKLKDEESVKLCGSLITDGNEFWNEDYYYPRGFLNTKESVDLWGESFDPNVVDYQNTLDGSKITIENFVKDFFNRFNIKVITVDENEIMITCGSNEDIDYIDLSKNRLCSDVNITKNGSDNSVGYFQITNSGGSLANDKYSDGDTTGSSEKIYIDVFSKENKTTSLQSSIVAGKMYKKYASISENESDVLTEIANIPPLFNMTPCDAADRKDYGIRYGFEQHIKNEYLPLVQEISNTFDTFYYSAPGYIFAETSYKSKSPLPCQVIIFKPSSTSTSLKSINTYADGGGVLIDFSGIEEDYYINYTTSIKIRIQALVGVVAATFDDSKKATIRNNIIIGNASSGYSMSKGVEYVDFSYSKVSNYIYDITLKYNTALGTKKIDSVFIPLDISPVSECTPSFLNLCPVDSGYRKAIVNLNKLVMDNGAVSLSFRNIDTASNENTVNALGYFFGDIVRSIYSKDAVFLEGNFYLNNSEIKALLQGRMFKYKDNEWMLVEASDIDYTSTNGCIVKLKLAKKWQ